MLNKAILFLLAMAAFSLAHAQNRYGIKLGAGLGHINNYDDPGQDGEFSTRSSLAGQVGIFSEWEINERWVAGAELLGSFVRGKNVYKLVYPYPVYPTVPSAWYFDKEYTDMVYLSAPLWLGFRASRWTFNAGAQVSVSLGGERTQDPGLESIEHVSNFEEGTVKNAKRVEFGPRVAAIYKLNERLALEASYYHGITNAFLTLYDTKTNIQQGLIGVRWAFQ